MEILILSDSHGRAHRIEEALSRQIKRPDAVLFLGDGLRDLDALVDPSVLLYAVRGNCDFFSPGADVPDERSLFWEGHRLLLCHGHTYGVKGGIGPLLSAGVRMGADLLLFGHTHMPYLERIGAGERIAGVTLERDVYLFNPGSLAQGSFGTLHLNGDEVLFSHGVL